MESRHSCRSLGRTNVTEAKGESLPTSVVLSGATVEHRDCLNHVSWLQQMPTGRSLLRTSTDGYGVDMILWEVELLKGSKHICDKLAIIDDTH